MIVFNWHALSHDKLANEIGKRGPNASKSCLLIVVRQNGKVNIGYPNMNSFSHEGVTLSNGSWEYFCEFNKLSRFALIDPPEMAFGIKEKELPLDKEL